MFILWNGEDNASPVWERERLILMRIPRSKIRDGLNWASDIYKTNIWYKKYSQKLAILWASFIINKINDLASFFWRRNLSFHPYNGLSIFFFLGGGLIWIQLWLYFQNFKVKKSYVYCKAKDYVTNRDYDSIVSLPFNTNTIYSNIYTLFN